MVPYSTAMSFWKKLFGQDFDTLVRRGEELLANGRPGEARLELERALTASKDVDAERVERVKRMVHEARDELARHHIEVGSSLAKEEHFDQARESFDTAAEVAFTEDIRLEARRLAERLEADDARDAYEEALNLTDEERFIALSGSWEDDQTDELDSYGEEFRQAFLDLHGGEAEKAADAMTRLVRDAEDPLFLYLELGQAQQAAGRSQEAIESFRTFLERLDELAPDAEDEEEDSEPIGALARIRANTELDRISLELGDVAAAEKQLRTLLDLMPDKTAAYVALGQFLRERGRAEESLEILEKGLPFIGEIHPDMTVVREIGLTHGALGHDREAIASLKAVIEHATTLGNFNFDPLTAIPLATLYEKTGHLEDASHLYRHLAAGTHAAGHFTYNAEAGRLLIESSELELARKYVTRANELARSDEERVKVQALLAKLD